MSTRARSIPVATAAAAALLAAPAGAGAGAATVGAGAGAATVATDMPCYVERQPARALLTGFTPNVDVAVTGDQVFASGVTDVAGSVTLAFTAPLRETSRPGSERVVLTATELTGPAPRRPVKVAFRVTTLSFASKGPRSPTAIRTWTFSGFRPGKPIYGHFRFKGRTRANHRFGVATAPCGELRRRAPAFPVRGRVQAGVWRIQVDQRRTYARSTTPRLATSTTVFTRAPQAIRIG